MTEIKIPFTKVEVKKYSSSNKPANAEGLELKIIPIFFNEIYEELPPDSCLNKMEFAFFDGAETAIYNDLLDDNKDKFELIFEKEKVNFYMVGGGKEPDDTKIGINYFAKGSNDTLKIFFKPQFSGTIKITHVSQDKDNKSSELDKKIAILQAKIKVLEDKANQPDTGQQQKREIQQQIQQLKNELVKKEKENKSQQPDKKGDFPWGIVIASGTVVVILLLVIICLVKNKKK